jgi:hypothetical protein
MVSVFFLGNRRGRSPTGYIKKKEKKLQDVNLTHGYVGADRALNLAVTMC